ncbi:MAG TPA: GFA family protein [Solirubrobacteraceae bacterium]|nr:GFA family protein [Solirubrobacteraceae bacterium]
MAQHHRQRTGGCLCGGVAYAVRGPMSDVVVCHCSRCRRTHGHTGAYAECAAADLELTASETLGWYAADGRERGFCKRCGASLFWRMPGAESVFVTAGTLDQPTGLRTVAHVHCDSRGDYYELPPDGVRHPGDSP